MDSRMSLRTREQWTPVPGAEHYDVSDRGGVRSWLVPGTRTGQIADRPRILIPSPVSKRGDLAVRINGSQVLVSRLVLTAFVRAPEPGEEACHEDRDPTRNLLTNLRWDTGVGNAADKERHGTVSRGESHGGSTLTEPEVLEIAVSQAPFRELAEQYDVSETTIRSIHTGRCWSWLTGITEDP